VSGTALRFMCDENYRFGRTSMTVRPLDCEGQ
jgi:hypothetical protein